MIVPPPAGKGGIFGTKGTQKTHTWQALWILRAAEASYQLVLSPSAGRRQAKHWGQIRKVKNNVLTANTSGPLPSISSPLFQTLKKRFPLEENVFLLFFNSLADDLFAFVVTAYRAYMMRFFQCMALRAFHKTRNSQLPVSTSLITTGSGTFCLRNRHS